MSLPLTSLLRFKLIYSHSGNFVVIAGTTLAVVGLTFGGGRYSWASSQVLAPLIIGLVTIAGFLLYDAKVSKEPTIPFEVLSNRTSFGGCVLLDLVRPYPIS